MVVATAMIFLCFPCFSHGLTVRLDVLLASRVDGHCQCPRGGVLYSWSSYTRYVSGIRAHADSRFLPFCVITLTTGMQSCAPKAKIIRSVFREQNEWVPGFGWVLATEKPTQKMVDFGRQNPTEKTTKTTTEKTTEKRLFGFRFTILLVRDPVCATTPGSFCPPLAMRQGLVGIPQM